MDVDEEDLDENAKVDDKEEKGSEKDESESEDDEKAKRYWELKLKGKDGRNKVSTSTVCVLISNIYLFVYWQPKKKSEATRDVRRCFHKDIRNINGELCPVHYCDLCLYVSFKFILSPFECSFESFLCGNQKKRYTQVQGMAQG